MISVKVSVKEKNGEPMKKLVEMLKKYKEAYVTVGVHDDAGRYTKGSPPPEVYEVALWQEFGTKNIPERSFIRKTVDENGSNIKAFKEKMVVNIIDHGWPVEKALEALGMYVQNLIQNKIRSSPAPAYGTGRTPNAPETIARLQEAKRKRVGHAQTLRETELLLRSVGYKVHLS